MTKLLLILLAATGLLSCISSTSYPIDTTPLDTNPPVRQVRLASEMLDSGADLIVGSGPHVVQRLDHDRCSSLAYSLGNTVFDGPGPDAQWSHGALLEVTLDKETRHISRARLITTHCDDAGVVKLK
jgi:hypothetical protein